MYWSVFLNSWTECFQRSDSKRYYWVYFYEGLMSEWVTESHRLMMRICTLSRMVKWCIVSLLDSLKHLTSLVWRIWVAVDILSLLSWLWIWSDSELCKVWVMKMYREHIMIPLCMVCFRDTRKIHGVWICMLCLVNVSSDSPSPHNKNNPYAGIAAYAFSIENVNVETVSNPSEEPTTEMPTTPLDSHIC